MALLIHRCCCGDDVDVSCKVIYFELNGKKKRYWRMEGWALDRGETVQALGTKEEVEVSVGYWDFGSTMGRYRGEEMNAD